MSYTHLVPTDSKRLIESYVEQCQNLALILGRYIPEEAIRNDDVLNDRGRAVDKVRSKWLANLLQRFSPAQLDTLLSSSLDRWFAMTTNASRFEMQLRGRMAVGLGGKNPLEFGITLNRLTGLPYIPGSALKGLARSYALLTLAEVRKLILIDTPLVQEDNRNSSKSHPYTEALEAYSKLLELSPDSKQSVIDEVTNTFKKKVEAYQKAVLTHGKHIETDTSLPLSVEESHFRLAFGTQADAGGCVFYDAVISNVTDPQKSLFTMDVMTPHFVKYYTSGGTPNDGDNPNPVSYVVVREGISFGFAIGTRTGFVDNGTRKYARNWLRSALEEMGIGAKTAQGYGVFKDMRGNNS